MGEQSYDAALSVDDANYDYANVEGYDAQTHKVTRAVSLTVTKGDFTPTISLEGWTYGEAPNTPVVTGNPSDGEVLIAYAPKADLDRYTTEVPTKPDDYTVGVYVYPTDNYNEAWALADFAIAKAPITITGTDKEVAYSADAIDIVALGMFTIPDVAGEASYGVTPVTGEGTFTNGTLTVTKVGTFAVEASTSATETHEAASAIATLTVGKVDPSVDAPAPRSLTYNGKAQELVEGGSAVGGALLYALGADAATAPAASAYSASIPTATDAGTYHVWYRVAGDDNHNDTEPACVTATIAEHATEQAHDLAPAVTPGLTPETTPVSMHRLYNPWSGEHFYTADDAEFAGLVELGWRDEGEGWRAPEKSDTPVFRMYNPYAGEHHYTMDAVEKSTMIEAGWVGEGVGWYSDDAKTVPLLREYNPYEFANNHNYTTDQAEHDGLIAAGWVDEGFAWYGV